MHSSTTLPSKAERKAQREAQRRQKIEKQKRAAKQRQQQAKLRLQRQAEEQAEQAFRNELKEQAEEQIRKTMNISGKAFKNAARKLYGKLISEAKKQKKLQEQKQVAQTRIDNLKSCKNLLFD